jgi:hypothetical protein
MKNMLLKVLKVVHWIVWFPLIPFFGSHSVFSAAIGRISERTE